MKYLHARVSSSLIVAFSFICVLDPSALWKTADRHYLERGGNASLIIRDGVIPAIRPTLMILTVLGLAMNHRNSFRVIFVVDS